MMKVRDSNGASTDLKADAPNENGFNHVATGSRKCNMTNKMIAKTLMQFFIDGYDTTGSQISMALYYLATQPEAQVSTLRFLCHQCLCVVDSKPKIVRS